MSIDIVFKIAAIGILTSIVNQILKQMGKDEIATIATLSGVVISLLMVMSLITELFDTVKTMFGL